MSYLKYKLIIIIGLALFCALTYDYCRNSTEETATIKPTKMSLKETEIRNKESIELGDVQGFIKATDLYEDFGKDAEKAKQKYIGRTFLIEGRISEIFILYNPPGLSFRAPGDNPVAGIMLFPETIKNYPNAPQYKIDFSFFPSLIFVDSDESALIEEKKFDRWENPYLDFSHYSEDFSYRSFFGGVYCMFSSEYLYKEQPKKSIEVKCKIKEYKKGEIEEIKKYYNEYSHNTENKRGTVESQPRVIAVGCIEVGHKY